MGVVYRGEHVYIGKEVAVKILHEGYGGREESIKRFLREARAASLINHPNIVNVTDFGKSNDGTVFFVMEFLNGEPLDALLQRERRLDLLRTITILNQMAGAVGAAHAKGIVHRDLKPENVMLTAREGRRELVRQIRDDGEARIITEREKTFDFVKILDFGVAKVRDPDVQEGRVTQQGVVFGTPEYMAPETARVGTSDPRSDIYALGVMFYEMLTGTVPFSGDTPVDVMLKVVSQPVQPPRDRAPGIEITEEAERLIMKALAKDPNRRQQTMEELYDELQRCYGSVKYRRLLTPGLTHPVGPIPLQRVKRQGSAGGTTTTSTPQPILLTKRKERKKTLPMDIGITDKSPTPASPDGPSGPITEEFWGAEEDDAWGDDLEGDLEKDSSGS
jgi:serine/threonine-protein kinase